jgi:hypothetical protein
MKPINKTTALQTVFKHLTTASETANGLIQAEVDTRMQKAIISINSEIIAAQGSNMAAQQEHSAMLDQVQELEARVSELEDQSAQLARYYLEEMDSGVRVYVLHEEEAVGCTDHEACPNCFAERRISVLQPTHETVRWSQTDTLYRVHQCPSCKATFAYRNTPKKPPPPVRRERNPYRRI